MLNKRLVSSEAATVAT